MRSTALKSPRILQFATHGYLLGRKKRRRSRLGQSALALDADAGGVNKRPEQAAFYRVGDAAAVRERKPQQEGSRRRSSTRPASNSPTACSRRTR